MVFTVPCVWLVAALVLDKLKSACLKSFDYDVEGLPPRAKDTRGGGCWVLNQVGCSLGSRFDGLGHSEPG